MLEKSTESIVDGLEYPMLAAMLDYGYLTAKLTSEMDSPPSTTHTKWYYTTLTSLDQKLNIDRNHAGWRPY